MKFFVLLIALLLPLSTSYSAQKVRVGVLDSGLDLSDPRFKDNICESGSADFTGTGLTDRMGHGTHVAGLIKQYAKNKNYCFVIVKYIDDYVSMNQSYYLNAITYLESQHLDVLNFSGGGGDFNALERDIYQYMSYVKVFVAAGNDARDIDKVPFFPASYFLNNMIVVSALGMNGKAASFTNWSSRSQWEPGEHILSTLPYSVSKTGMGYMNGSSMATAIASGRYIYERY